MTLFFILVPDNDLVNKIRGLLYKPLLKRCGKNLRVAPQARILRPEKLSVGNNVYIGFNSYIGEGSVSIEDNVLVGNFVSITASNHKKVNGSFHGGGYEDMGIVIRKNAWIGAHVSLLAGCEIGEGSVVGAGAVVNKKMKANCLIVGIPAKEKSEYL